MGADADALLADDVQNLLAQKRAGQPVTAATVRELRRERLQPPSQPLGPMMVVRTQEPSQPRDSPEGMTVGGTAEQVPPAAKHPGVLNPPPNTAGASGRGGP